MQDLIKQEQFELEVLERLNSSRLLNNLIFCGGTMLRLCFGLNRFSVDMDFWLTEKTDKNQLFKNLKDCLAEGYALKDAANKFYTLLFEIRSKGYPRSLKIEIRKEKEKTTTEQAIAFSPYSNTQVILRVATLKEMMKAKIAAFLSRKEIRDAFDIEFLLKKGVALSAPIEDLSNVLAAIEKLDKNDYRIKLGSLLEEGQRRYYNQENFKILRLAIQQKLL